MVVPFAAGGGLDVLGRILAARMSEILGHQVIIENATGAAGIVGVKRVVNAAPDGYTFLLGTIGTHAYNQTIYRTLRYDAVADFTPVALFAEQPMVLTARKDFPADNFTQFIANLKTNSAKLQFGSAGVGTMTHLGCALLNATIGVNVTHVPYRGGGPASNDLIGGQIDYLCLNVRRCSPADRGQTGKGYRDAVAKPLAGHAGLAHCSRAGTRRLRRCELDCILSSERRAPRGREKAQRRNKSGAGHSRD